MKFPYENDPTKYNQKCSDYYNESDYGWRRWNLKPTEIFSESSGEMTSESIIVLSIPAEIILMMDHHKYDDHYGVVKKEILYYWLSVVYSNASGEQESPCTDYNAGDYKGLEITEVFREAANRSRVNGYKTGIAVLVLLAVFGAVIAGGPRLYRELRTKLYTDIPVKGIYGLERNIIHRLLNKLDTMSNIVDILV